MFLFMFKLIPRFLYGFLWQSAAAVQNIASLCEWIFFLIVDERGYRDN